jgi:CubicO group peptidase (beta-lactamase class C family)
MHQRLRILIAAGSAVAASVLLTTGPAPAAPLAAPAEIRATLDAYAVAHPHAVIVAGVVDGADTSTYTAHGQSAIAADDRVRFQIGSLTKTFTATLLAQMVLAHEVALDDPIQKYLPAGVRAPDYRGTPITLRTLAEQRSGLPRLATNMPFGDPANPYADYTVAMLYDFLAHYTLPRAPGAEFEYSNYGYTLLGQLLANRAHTSYADLVQRRILDPLGMKDTVVTGTPATRAHLAPGYTQDDRPQRAWDFGPLGAAGSIESDLHDMLIYVRANLAAPSGPLGPAMALAQTPHAPTSLVPGSVVQIGLAWLTNTRSAITWHDGATYGYESYLALDRSAQHAVVVLLNVGDPALERLALHVFAPSLVAAPAYAPAQSEASPYAGVYRFAPALALTVFRKDGRLYAQLTGQNPLALTPISGHTFAVAGVDAQLTFDVDANGVATAVTLHQNGTDQRAAKAP